MMFVASALPSKTCMVAVISGIEELSINCEFNMQLTG